MLLCLQPYGRQLIDEFLTATQLFDGLLQLPVRLKLAQVPLPELGPLRELGRGPVRAPGQYSTQPCQGGRECLRG